MSIHLPLSYFGRSLGGAVSFHVAETWERQQVNPPLAGMIVENTFCSIDEMADIIFPILKPIKGPLLRMHWNSKVIAPKIQTPILYLAGGRDEIVPPSQMQALYQLSQQGCSRYTQFHAVPNGMHNDTWIQGGKPYWQAMLHFINKVAKRP